MMSVLKINSSDSVVQQHGMPSNIQRLQTLERRFNEQLFNQPYAVEKVCSLIRMVVTGFYNDKVPLGVLLFAGPTGVGKTELAKIMATELGIPFHRFDMSEFQHESSVNRFLGAPPGYIGSQNGGELVKTLKTTPVCVVLFDEIEKAHPSIFNVFLQLFDEGRLTDAMGAHVTTKHVIFVMTTNLGTREFSLNDEKSQDQKQEILKSFFIKRFSPELFNRIQHSVVFNSLDKNAIGKIAVKHLKELTEVISKRKKIIISLDKQLKKTISKLESDLSMGARGIQRKVSDFVLPALANSYANGDFFDGGKIELHKQEGSDQVSIRVLDKGIPQIPNEEPPQSNARVIYFSRQGQPAKNFIGKYVVRSDRCNGDGSYMREAFKITKITSEGMILGYDKEDHRVVFGSPKQQKEQRLEPKWNDDKWMLPVPSLFPKEFLENLSFEIEADKRKEYLRIVDSIFKELDIAYLPHENPLQELKAMRMTNGLSQEIDRLEQLVGNIQVVEQESTEAALSTTYDLSFLGPSNKRKREE